MRNLGEEPIPVWDSKKWLMRWSGRFRKGLKTLVQSEVGLSVLIACISIIAITSILSGRYLGANDVIQSGVSTRDVIANRSFKVEDREAIQRLRYEARQMIAPIYKKLPGEDKAMVNGADALMQKIQTIRTSAAPALEKQEAFQALLGQQEGWRPEIGQNLLETDHWPKIRDTAIKTLQQTMTQGLSAESYFAQKEMVIRRAFPLNANLNEADELTTTFLVESVLHPDLMIDERSTEEARDIAASHIKPVIETFNKGDHIVNKGDKVTGLQREALYVHGNLMNRHRGLSTLGVLILSVSLMSIVWIYLYRFEHHSFLNRPMRPSSPRFSSPLWGLRPCSMIFNLI